MVVTLGIVVYFNSKQEVEKLVKSIKASVRYMARKQDLANVKIRIAVRNSGDKHDSEMYQKVFGDGVPIADGDNIGFGRAHNFLMEQAFAGDTDAYIAVNPDCVLHPRCLHEIIGMNKKFPSTLIEAYQAPNEHPKPYNPLTFETPWVSGAFLLMTRDIYEVTKGFDEEIFMYCEDVDLSWRAQLAGFGTRICPSAWVYHDSTNRRLNPVIENEMLTAGRYLAKKWGDQEFLSKVEKRMLEVGPCRDRKFLPSLDSVVTIDRAKARSVSEFRRMFHFSEARW